jgi:hypothetical protein
MCIQNSALARQGGIKVQNLLSPLAVANAVISPNSPTGYTADIEGDGKCTVFWLGGNVVCPFPFFCEASTPGMRRLFPGMVK